MSRTLFTIRRWLTSRVAVWSMMPAALTITCGHLLAFEPLKQSATQRATVSAVPKTTSAHPVQSNQTQEERSQEATKAAGTELNQLAVELFAAMRGGDISVELSALSSRSVWLKVTNKTDATLSITLPRSFAGVPVLAQVGPGVPFLPGAAGRQGLGLGNNLAPFGNVPGGNALGGGQLGGGATGAQGIGGGFNNVANGIGNQGIVNPLGGGANPLGNIFGNGVPAQGMFRVAPGRTGKVQAQTVCLEHGKHEPTPQMKYRIVPLAEFTNGDGRIDLLCRYLAENRVTQNVAQAVAWHIANNLPWEELATKDRVRSKSTGNQKFFTSEELQTAMQVSQAIEAASSITPSLSQQR